MDLVTILRELWRIRRGVGLCCLVAIFAALMVAYRVGFPPKLQSRKYEVGVANVRVLVDTPSSQVVEVAPKGSDTLGVRANLLASLMVDGVVEDAIARGAGIPSAKLQAYATSAADQPPAPKPNPRGYVLTTRVLTNTDGNELPIIEISTQAPDAARAAKLANSAVAGLRQYLDSQAAMERVPDARRLRVSGLGAAQATEAVRGSRLLLAMVLAILVALGGSAALLITRKVARDWRTASQTDTNPDDGALNAPITRFEDGGPEPAAWSDDRPADSHNLRALPKVPRNPRPSASERASRR